MAESPGASSGSIVTSLSFLAVAAGRTAQRRIDEELGPLGLSLRHVGALGHLAHRDDLSYSDLARRSGVTAQSMRATVQELEDMGAVRRRDARQGVRATLAVTRRGRALLARVGVVAADLDRALFAAVPEASRQEVRSALFSVAMPQRLPSTAPDDG